MTRLVITAVVAVHLAASLWHGSAHSRLAIDLPAEKTLFVFIVILIAPIAAAALVWTRYFSIGLWVLFLSMLGSFLFGVYHHYLLVSPDNIAHLPAGSPEMHSQFITSAGVIALIELAAALFGAYSLGTYHAKSRRPV
ncbi:MAG TPA: hypothetical protein VFH15_06695 [Pyrinomonadaceae bacterium]|nr:hypothetical protein [Pyrinomonadaceae bacterium]